MKQYKIILMLFLMNAGTLYSQTLIPYREGKLWGYCDSTKKIIIPIQFDSARLFFGEKAVVYKEGKAALINRSGEIAAPFFYEDITEMEDTHEYYWVHNGNKVGIADAHGNEKVPVQYASIDPGDWSRVFDWTTGYADNHFFLYRNDSCFVYDLEGNILLKSSQKLKPLSPYFLYSSIFDEKYQAQVSLFDYQGKSIWKGTWVTIKELNDSLIQINFKDSVRIYDGRLNRIFPEYDHIHKNFAVPGYYYIYHNHKAGIIDERGKVIVPAQFQYIGYMRDSIVIGQTFNGNIAIYKYDQCLLDTNTYYIYGKIGNFRWMGEEICVRNQEGKAGVISVKNDKVEIVIPFSEIHYIWPNTKEGINVYSVKEKPDFINERGNFLKQDLSKKERRMLNEGTAFGYIRNNGSFLTPPVYNSRPNDFSEGRAMVPQNSKHSPKKAAYIDTSAKVVTPYNYFFSDDTWPEQKFKDGVACVTLVSTNKRAYIRRDGSVIPMEGTTGIYATDAQFFQKGVGFELMDKEVTSVRGWSSSECYFIDTNGRRLNEKPYIYYVHRFPEHGMYFHDNLYYSFEKHDAIPVMNLDWKQGLFHYSGKEIIPCLYDRLVVINKNLVEVSNNGSVVGYYSEKGEPYFK